MENIYNYIKEHATPQAEALSWVEKQTHLRTNHARMLSGAVQGQLMRMLVQMTKAERILELGTFTGYSAICMASALDENGHLVLLSTFFAVSVMPSTVTTDSPSVGKRSSNSIIIPPIES